MVTVAVLPLLSAKVNVSFRSIKESFSIVTENGTSVSKFPNVTETGVDMKSEPAVEERCCKKYYV